MKPIYKLTLWTLAVFVHVWVTAYFIHRYQEDWLLWPVIVTAIIATVWFIVMLIVLAAEADTKGGSGTDRPEVAVGEPPKQRFRTAGSNLGPR